MILPVLLILKPFFAGLTFSPKVLIFSCTFQVWNAELQVDNQLLPKRQNDEN